MGNNIKRAFAKFLGNKLLYISVSDPDQSDYHHLTGDEVFMPLPESSKRLYTAKCKEKKHFYVVD